MTLNAKIQKRFRKITAVISLVVMIVPLFPPATFAQEVTPSLDPTPDPIAQPSDAPAPAPSGLDFNINPGGSNPGIVPNNPSPSNSVPDNSSLVPDSAPTPASSPELSPNTSPEASTPPPQTESIDPTTPPQNEIFDSQTPQHAEINSNNGAFTHRYPIAIPPGRNNVQPKVELAYTSNDTDINSIFGKGWSLSIPYIQRENKYGVDQLYSTTSSPFFFSSIDGELATTTVTSTYAARVDNGSFNSYITTSNQWLVSDKNGTQYKYGYSAASRQDDSTTSAHVFKWMLEEVRDTNDNYISYTYYKDNGEIYLSSITYTGNGATPGVFEIDFQRESRTDTATSSQTGFAVKTNSRINEIDAKVNGTLVHKYALAYTPGASTSLLSSITETGYDESSNPTTLPATMFTYKSNTPGWAGDATWLSPVQLINGSVDQGYQIVDVNGDGLPDIMRSTYTTICCGNPPIFTHDSYINNGHGWSIDHSWDLPVNWMSEGYSNGYQFIDVNGDHLPDIVYSNSNGGYETWINNAHGWTLDSSWNLPVALDTAWPPTDNGYRFTDVNGDGLPDIVRGDSTRGYESYINNGHGWGSDDSSWHVPVALTTNGTTDNGYKIVDVNGDTLPDIVFSQGASTYTSYLNNGHGWTLDSNWNLPVLLRDNSAHDNAYQIVDINGDHLPDIVRGDSTLGYESYINNGHGWGSDDSSWHLPTYLSSNTVARGFKFADVNGDGLMDQLYRQDPDNLAQMGNGQIVDQLTEISHPAGGKTDIQYKHVAGYLDGSNNLTNTTVPFFLNTVYKLSTSDGTTTSTLDTFSYKGGRFQYYSPIDKRFAAFAEVDKTDNAGNVTKTYYHTATGTDSVRGEFQDNYWKIGKPYRVEKYDASSNLFQKTINKWDSATSTSSIAGFAKLAQSETLDYDGLASHKDKAESYTYNNANGDQTQKVAYGEVAGNDDGTFSDTGTDKFTTDFTYATSTTATLMSVVNHVTVSDQSASNVKETKYTYDNLAFGVVDKGNQTKEENWKVSTSFASSSRAFNSYGLVATSTAPRGKTTTYVYDAYNVYPATTTQPLSLVSQKTYNYATGKVDQTTDENGNKFLNTYDGLGRLTLVQQPDPSATTTLLTNTAYIYTDATGSVSIRQTTYLNSSTTVNAYTYYDGLKRTKQARRSAGADNFETKDLAYNSIGLLQQESLPYFSASSANTTATSTAALYTTYTYDALQRPLTSANVLGTTTKAYINWKTTVTDANGKEKAFTNDAYGNLIRVDEQNASATYTTTYTYNGLNGLTNITDASGNVRNFTYDGLGRRLTAQDLHASADATYGTWTYTYDDAGSLTQVVDPNSQTINRTYDDLNRVLTEDYTGQAGTEVKYTYDSCTQGLTRLCTASSSALSVTSTYNVLGQLTQESKTISGTSTSFITSYTYDRQGNQLIITNPDNSKVQYTYNIGGRPETIQRKEATDASYLDVVTDFDYSSTGKVSFQANANCTKTWNTYDPAKLYRLTNKLTVYDCTQSSGMMSMINPGDPGDASGLMKPAALSDEPAPETITTPAPSVEPAPSSTPAPSPAVEPTPGPSSSPPPVQLSLLDTASSKLAQTVLGWNSKVVIQSNGAKRSEIHIKQLNFKDVDGAFKPINATPVPAANGWEVTQNPFIARFPARSVGTAAMVNNNRFDTRTLTDINEPDLTMTITALGVSDVAGVLEYGDVGYGPEWYVRYPQAYPAEDADLIYLVWQGKVPRLQKLVRFNSALSADTDFSFQFAFPDKDPDFIRSTRVKWDKASKLTTNRAISVGKAGDRHGFSFKDFNIWDSNHAKRKVEAVTVDMERNAGGYTLTKHISAAFFAGATYPVFTDTTNTFYPDYDPETTSVDGLVYDNNPGSRSWASMRAATGDGAQPSVAFNNSPYIQTSPTTNLYVQLWRDVFLFDTSSIPDSDIITTATLSLYGDVAGNQLGSSVTIVQPNPTSNTDLVAGDFDVSTHWTMTQQNTADISYGSWVAGGYNTFALSATGLGNISKTGISNFGAVSNWDRDNTAPTWAASKDDYVGMYFADQAGTSQDPKLVVVSISGTPPIAPTNLLAEGQTSPTGVMDLTPEFSAIFNDPNTGDTSRLYQLQVSTSSTNWSSLMWDSGTSVMATTTQGTRSPDISYGGTALTYNGTTYYWRIKFWDQGLLEGLFSTSTASFTMYHNYAPTTSTSLLAEGQTNPTGVMSLTPKFSAIYIDPNTSDTASYYNVQVSASSANWSNLMWDSGTSVMATTTQGNRSPDITYAGSTLAWDGSTYYWRIKFWDTIGAEGAFSSTSAATFTMGTGGNVIQNISYTYDAVGNITKIVNSSPTNASSTITYVYDDLYRLTSANTAYTAPWIPGYSQSYTYDALGNMLSKTDIGTYLYATSTTPGYANPDAAISIAGGSINYDTNGNVISASSTTSSGWSVNGGIWNRRTPITIDHTKVSGSGTLANFPMLFSVTGTEFKTLANGGYVTSATGADIFFTSNDGVTKLNHELETYTATAGTVIAWVQIPLLKTSTDTVIYVYYGNASSVSQQASTAVWDSNYVGVYHLPDGTTLSATDSTAFANNGTSTNASALNGKIGGAAKFSGTTTSYISMANSSSLSITSAVTLSGWLYLNASTFANYTGLIRKGSTSNYYPNNYMVQGIAGTRLLQLVYAHSANNNDWINSSGSVAASGWTYVSAVIDTANNFRGIYLNGVLDTSSSVSAEAMTTSTDPVWLGKRHDAGLNGYLDEVRISKSARSADWIKTAYNNESTSTFFSLGTASSNVRTITPKTYYTWDYLNRLTRVVANSATSSYMYDPWGQRVRVAVATSTTATSYYPTKFYNMSRWVPTKHIFANGEDIATITGSGTAAVVSYIHPDHLAGANVLTDSNGSISELLDYLPYGSTRLDQQTGSAPSEQRKFIGEQYDPASQLSYLNARFYDGAKGKFLSQDPVFWEVGLTSDGKNAMANPQAMNSYSYANGNPIINKDPDGRCPICVPLVVAGGVGAIGGVGAQAFSDLLYGGFSQRTWQQNLTTYGVSAVGGATVGVGGVVAGVAAAAAGLSAAATAVTVGGTAGSLTIGTTVAGNRLLGQPTNPVGLAVTAALSALSAGLLKTLPEVPGRLPTFNSQAFYTGTHTLRQGAEEFLSNSLQSLGQTAVRVAAPAIQSFTSTFQGFVPKLRSSN